MYRQPMGNYRLAVKLLLLQSFLLLIMYTYLQGGSRTICGFKPANYMFQTTGAQIPSIRDDSDLKSKSVNKLSLL